MRTQFETTVEEDKEIDRQMKVCDLRTKKELFQNWKSLFGWVINETLAGRKIVSMDKNNLQRKELVMPAISAASSKANR